MDEALIPNNHYLLLTPGPLSTSRGVRAAMFRDWCTWDRDYNDVVQSVRTDLVGLVSGGEEYTSVLMQGSGTYCVEATIGTAVPADGRLLILANGHYGDRMAKIAGRLGIDHQVHNATEIGRPDLDLLNQTLEQDRSITHVAVVHCETTTGMLNPVEDIAGIVKSGGRTLIVDAMSSLGGIPIDADALGIDFLISSANKCIQGAPGFGFVLARRTELEKCEGRARSLSLDLYDQWNEMEKNNGKWRFTSPTHVVRAFAQALKELEEEGGVEARYSRYKQNHRTLVRGLGDLGFTCLLPDEWQSPIITSFFNPDHPDYDFIKFYTLLKEQGFVIYPGKVTGADTFRIGNIGHVFPEDMRDLAAAVKKSMYWR